MQANTKSEPPLVGVATGFLTIALLALTRSLLLPVLHSSPTVAD